MTKPTVWMPPEWHPQDWIWIGFPHDPVEWPGFLEAAQEQIAAFANAVAESELDAGNGVERVQLGGVVLAQRRGHAALVLFRFGGEVDRSREMLAQKTRASHLMSRIDTMKLVKVVKVTPGTGAGDVKLAGTVDVQPLVNQIDGNGNSTPHGTVFGVPWTRLQGGKNCIVCDPEVGDLGYVVVSDRDISAVKSTKKQGNPGSRRKYNLADGVYIGGILNLTPDQYMQMHEGGIRIVDKNGNSVVMSTTGITVKPALGMPVTIDGNLAVVGDLQLGGAIKGDAGGLYPGNLETAGGITAGKGTADEVTVQHHTHQYDRPTGPSAPAQSNAPTAGT